ncbi:MAG: serine hydrolase family protein [Candidatus Yanofskybacteria bacterium]|nr:serine hydrolase family protein [Candidatus Yanofskybacteria bacterium]
MKRVFIIHGWEGYPEENWFPWLKKELEAKGFEVFVPQMPDADSPRIEKWIPKISEIVGVADGNTYFVGHSMGCQAVARFLETLPEGIKVGGAIFVAGFFKRLTGLGEEPNFEEVKKEWLGTPLDLGKTKNHLNKSVAIFSDNDPYVPSDNIDDFRNKLGSKIIIQRNMYHFSGNWGTTELPIVLEELLKMTKLNV